MFLLFFLAIPVQAACRLALAIGLDISGSVDAGEYRLQLDGLAAAMLNREVSQAFLAMPGAPVSLFIFEWAGPQTQRPLLPWTAVTDELVLQDIAEKLRTMSRQPHQVATALGQAMIYGARALQDQSSCWRHTLDLSGDGQSNIGPRPQDIRSRLPASVTINALVIGTDAGDRSGAIDSDIALLTSYFKARVIRGPYAFVEAAIGFRDFEDAMARKLLKELQTPVIGALSPEGQ